MNKVAGNNDGFLFDFFFFGCTGDLQGVKTYVYSLCVGL